MQQGTSTIRGPSSAHRHGQLLAGAEGIFESLAFFAIRCRHGLLDDRDDRHGLSRDAWLPHSICQSPFSCCHQPSNAIAFLLMTVGNASIAASADGATLNSAASPP